MVEKLDPKESRSGRADAPDSVTARRERGKLAQRAFRQRQIDTIRSLEGENQRLRKAISDISVAARQSDVALSLAISSACGVAGLPTSETDDQPALTNSEDSGWSSNDDAVNVAPVSSDAVSSDYDNIFKYLIPSFDDKEVVDEWSQFFPTGDSETYVSPTNLEIFDSGIDMTPPPIQLALGPPLNTVDISQYTFEPDRAIHLTNPPPDIVPYMGEGAYTLAGQIYWTAMAFGFQAIKAIISTSTPPPAAVNTVSDIFTHTLKHIPLPKLMYLMHARLAFRRYGYFHLASDENWEAIKSFLDPTGPAKIHAALSDSLQKSGVRKDDFLTPLTVEQRLRDRFQDAYPVFEAALRGRAVAAEHVACMRQLMRVVSRQSLCFGDGPRWRPESVDALAAAWERSVGVGVGVF
ncbi:uncharacterized protein GGS22DRAFT_178214 [Annulohypoxylon maeteangense]|uniref:uncharacterized protein n=1 Tax=Annulohypoxylon maeteangense TaxID=1927788 RepID=UPI00200790DB|nr:uncharacterized protein GGS22DRAFT_178214 [Annulohypoxylon maeteangense]KAI0888343.1 hypothetical protein GGS22DRAFT_178214 [Annulohypoxylon maeteangense]